MDVQRWSEHARHANGANDDPGADVFKRFPANADAAGTSVIFLDTWAISYGSYQVAGVPVGDYQMRIQAGGYGVHRQQVTVQSGQSTVVDALLTTSRVVAVAGDSFDAPVAALLTAEGYDVRAWNWADIHLHIPDLSQVEAVILNGSTTAPTADELNQFLTAAAQAQVSVILAGQFRWDQGGPAGP